MGQKILQFNGFDLKLFSIPCRLVFSQGKENYKLMFYEECFLNECCRVQKLRRRVKKIVKPQRVMTEISSLCSLSKGAFHIFSKTWRKMMRSIFRESNAGRQKTWTYKFIKLNITEFWRRHHAKEELNCRKRGNSVVEIGAHESFLCNICSSVVHRCFFTMLIKSESNESKSYVLSIIKRANRTAAVLTHIFHNYR